MGGVSLFAISGDRRKALTVPPPISVKGGMHSAKDKVDRIAAGNRCNHLFIDHIRSKGRRDGFIIFIVNNGD